MQKNLKISCGLDIHKETIEACLLKDIGQDEPEIIRESFTAMRGDLLRLKDWLLQNECENVAMESTGVFWKPVYEILEEVGTMNLCVVNAHHMRNLPGRKTDVKDAHWIALLFMYGLLEKSFVPERGIRDLRECTRLYTKFTQSSVRIINQIEKHLQMHGFKLSSVLSDIVGVSGKKILEQLSAKGSLTTTEVEAALERGVKKTPAEIAYAINGILHLPARMILRTLLDALYTMERQLEEIRKNQELVAKQYWSSIELLDTIPGIHILSATYIIAEIGVCMDAFPTEAQLISWAGLCPRNDESAGIIKSRKTLKGNHYVKSILCQCAWAAVKTKNTRISNWFWRNVGRLGQKVAIIAVARKLLGYIYHILKTQTPYDHQLDIADTAKKEAQKLHSVASQISKFQQNVATMSALENDIADTIKKCKEIYAATNKKAKIKSPISNSKELDPSNKSKTEPKSEPKSKSKSKQQKNPTMP